MTQQEIDTWFQMMHDVKMEYLIDVRDILKIELREFICGSDFWFSMFALGDTDVVS
mgnify:CR=1 FL=1